MNPKEGYGEGDFKAVEKAISLGQGKSKIISPPPDGGCAERASNPPT